MQKLTQAFIFCAGRGERMRPLTDSIPKPLVKSNNKALLDYTIEKINKIPSIEKIIVNGYYLSQQIADHLAKLNNPKIIFSLEHEKVETGGALVIAKDLIDFNQPLLLANGDVFWQETKSNDIELLMKNFDKNQHDMLLGLKKFSDYQGAEKRKNGKFGDFDLKANKALYRRENDDMSHCFVGLQIINPQIINNAPSKCFSVSHYCFSKIQKDGLLKQIQGVELEGDYYHIGKPEAIAKTEKLLKNKI